ncbi:hypothetical protein I0C86_40755 [Plantactinospora sp. S1510]|uniref:Uncharacterized protein n=1 Tax=Plantactinospora alkalitolerans TaxID=2789879 RepID=A0ABS0H9P9_9ACTN|nr:hypothetical protein [Plantactinospora alkalitolerans]MBF9135212.1 hypothetical protein [Plantactinospora alkalitolerans]
MDKIDPIDPDEVLGLIDETVGSDSDCSDLINPPGDGAELPVARIGADLFNEWAAGGPIPRQRAGNNR